MADQASLPDNFEIITDVVCVDADNFTIDDDDDEPVRCNCRSNGGLPICSTEDCYNYATQIECVACYKGCRNNRIQRKRYAKLYTKDTAGKGHGLFAGEDLVAGQFVMEYVGETVSSKELNNRLQRLREASLKNGDVMKHLYVMQLKPGVFLDARRKGSISRFINHSCEPNCLIEIWTVGKRLRVGIFTMKDIPADGELNFDYQWSPSKGRPPTKCLCGTQSCRGTIEVLPSNYDDASNAASIQLLRRGVWRPRQELPYEFANNPKLFVSRRVQVWWDGNQEYFEADVIDYIESSGKHICRYDIDGTSQEEYLIPSTGGSPSAMNQRGPGYEVDWNWLDESQEELVIKKKDREEEQNSDELELMDFMPVSQIMTKKRPTDARSSNKFVSYGLNAPAPAAGTSAHTHTTIRVHYDVAQWTVDKAIQLGDSPEDADRIQPFDTTNNKSLCWTTFLGQLEHFYKCKAYISTSSISDTMNHNINHDIKDINIVGEPVNVNKAVAGVNNARTAVINKLKKISVGYTESLQKYQGVVMTKDWRRYPITAPNDSCYEYEPLRELLAFNGRTRCVLSKEQLIFLKRSKPAVSSGGSKPATVSDSVRRSALSNLRGMMSKLSASVDMSLHATIILLRYLSSGDFGLFRLSDDAIVKDMTAIIASSFLLASKSSGRNHFKVKSIKRIIVCAYSQVFSRSEKDVEATMVEYYLLRTLDKERDILTALQYDVYFTDVSSIVFANRALSSTNESCQMIQQIVHQAFELLVSLLFIVPDLFLSVSVELLMYSSIAIVSNMKLQVSSVDSINSYPDLIALYKTLTCAVLESAVPEFLRLQIFHSFNKDYFAVAYKSILRLILLAPSVYETIAGENSWFKDSCDCFLYNTNAGRPGGLEDLYGRSIGFVFDFLHQSIYTSFVNSVEDSFIVGHAISRANSLTSSVKNGPDAANKALLELSKTTNILKSEPIVRGYKFRHPLLQKSLINSSANNFNHIEESKATISASSDHTSIMMSRDLCHIVIPSGDLTCINARHVELSLHSTESEVKSNDKKPMIFSLRSFPTAKQGQHEWKKASAFAPQETTGASTGSGLGVSWTSIRELFILQHLHTIFPVSNEPAGAEIPSTHSPHFIVPIGIYDASSGFGEATARPQAQVGSDNDLEMEISTDNSTGQKQSSSTLATSIQAIRDTKKKLERLSAGKECESKRQRLLTELKQIQNEVNCSQNQYCQAMTPVGLSILVKPVLMQLQSIFPLLQLPEESFHMGSMPVSSDLVRCLIYDAISAVDHMSTCGVYLKWLSLEHVYISSTGCLVIGELSGACIADRPYFVTEQQQQHQPKAHSSEERRERRGHGHGQSSKVTPGSDRPQKLSSTSSRSLLAPSLSGDSYDLLDSSDAKKRKHSSSKHAGDSKSRHQTNNHDSHKKSDSASKHRENKREIETEAVNTTAAVTPPTLPHLAMTPPEIILGDVSPRSPSIFTNVWLAGALAVYIASGKPITKTGNSEEKHLQNLFKILGTPHTMGYHSFALLPFANIYGGQIMLDDGVSRTESRCRIHKVMRSNIPRYILNALSPSKSIGDPSQKKGDLADNGDDGFLLDFIFNSTHLVPWKRHFPRDLLATDLFTSSYVSANTLKDRYSSIRRILDYMESIGGKETVAHDTIDTENFRAKQVVDQALQIYLLTDIRLSNNVAFVSPHADRKPPPPKLPPPPAIPLPPHQPPPPPSGSSTGVWGRSR